MSAMKRLFQVMAEKKASDIFLSVGSPINIKINGVAMPVNQTVLNADAVKTLLYEVLNEHQISEYEKEMELNTAYALEGVGAFRISAFRQKGSPAVVVRFIPGDVPKFDTLGLPDVLKELILRKRGLILMVGATGSGKSTSLAAMLDLRNEQKSGHILTLEDPVEFIFKNKKSIVNQREVGSDTRSFEIALKNALRQAPDCILIGEIRDKQTMGMALAYAQSGHLALATLHANNSYHAMNRIISFYPAGEPAHAAARPFGRAAGDHLAAPGAHQDRRAQGRGRSDAQHAPHLGTDREGRHQRDQGRHGKEHGARLADLRAVAVQDVHGRADHAGRVHGERRFAHQHAVADQPGDRRRHYRPGARPSRPATTRRTRRRKASLSNTGRRRLLQRIQD